MEVDKRDLKQVAMKILMCFLKVGVLISRRRRRRRESLANLSSSHHAVVQPQ